ncbi:MAG: hypothetical protein HDR26_04730 [Lachnospiraceae bacterium]|nr:hypothetical protein [Lachnospiraceae bacterium]
MKENLKNIMKYQKKLFWKTLAWLIPMDLFAFGLVGVAVVAVSVTDGFGAGSLFFGALLLILTASMAVIIWKCNGVDKTLKELTPEEQARMNEDCIDGYRIGNTVVCRDGFLLAGVTMQALPYRDIVFVYENNTTYTTVAVPLYKVRSVIGVNRKKKQFVINAAMKPPFGKSGKGEIQVQQLWEILQQNAPWVYLGGSVENMNLYLNRFDEMARTSAQRYEQDIQRLTLQK